MSEGYIFNFDRPHTVKEVIKILKDLKDQEAVICFEWEGQRGKLAALILKTECFWLMLKKI